VLHPWFDYLALDSWEPPTDAETKVPLFHPLETRFWGRSWSFPWYEKYLYLLSNLLSLDSRVINWVVCDIEPQGASGWTHLQTKARPPSSVVYDLKHLLQRSPCLGDSGLGDHSPWFTPTISATSYSTQIEWRCT
jgi:hypothetical protein